MVTCNDRDIFIGAHVTPEVKDALKASSKHHNRSMSRIIYEALVARLQSEGHRVELIDDFTQPETVA